MAGLRDGEIQLWMLLKYGIQYEEGEGNVGIMDLLLAFLVGAPNLKLTIVKGVYKNHPSLPRKINDSVLYISAPSAS